MTCIILEVYIVIWQEILIVNLNFTLFPLPKSAIFVPRLPYLWKNCQMAASNLFTTYFEISQDYFHQVDIKFSGKAHTNHHIQNLNICHFPFCQFFIVIIGQWPAVVDSNNWRPIRSLENWEFVECNSNFGYGGWYIL